MEACGAIPPPSDAPNNPNPKTIRFTAELVTEVAKQKRAKMFSDQLYTEYMATTEPAHTPNDLTTTTTEIDMTARSAVAQFHTNSKPNNILAITPVLAPAPALVPSLAVHGLKLVPKVLGPVLCGQP